MLSLERLGGCVKLHTPAEMGLMGPCVAFFRAGASRRAGGHVVPTSEKAAGVRGMHAGEVWGGCINIYRVLIAAKYISIGEKKKGS